MTVSPIPAGYHTITPFMIVADADAQIEFIKRAFDGTLNYEMRGEGGRIRHAELTVGDSRLMLSEACEQYPANNTMIYLYVPDCDAVYKQAIAAGGENIAEPKDQFYGDRSGAVRDPNGNPWWIGTRKEDLTNEELDRRVKAQAQ